MTDCGDFAARLGSEELAERARARRHALECHACRVIFDADERLTERLASWEREVEPPPELEARIEAAVRRRLAARVEGPARGRRWLPLAAALLLAVGLGFWLGLSPGAGPTQAENLLVADALADAKRAERQHARAIASLERAVTERLARAEDPSVPAAEAALLLSYRDRIASLEATIEEVRDYLSQNPAHPGARTVLLAAYRDKTRVLREVLALGEPT